MLANAQEAIERLLDKLAKTKPNQIKVRKTESQKPMLNIVKPVTKVPVEDYEAILERVFAIPKYKALSEGDYSAYGHDWSSADMALMCRLAIECKLDPEAMEHIFSLSPLANRDKFWNREDYRRKFLVDKAIDFISKHHNFSDELPEIIVSGRPTQKIASEALESLTMQNDLNPTLFLMGNTLVRLQTPHTGRMYTEEVTQDILKYALNRSANWLKIDSKGIKSHRDCPDNIVKDILATPQLSFPHLKGIAQVPMFLPTGELVSLPGYNPDLDYYLNLNGLSDKMTTLSMVTSAELTEAVSFIHEELLSDFPFEDDASRANAFALLLLPFVRHLINGQTPLHLIDAPTAGSGKTLLANLITLVATGRITPATGEAHKKEEWAKLLLSILMATPTFVFLDNLNRKLDSSELASILTTSDFHGRILGLSKQAYVSTDCMWITTGNNTQVSTEISRRAAHIRLLPPQARPHERTQFRHTDFLQWVEKNRWDIVRACLVIVKYWFQLGKPLGEEVFNSYNDYAAVLGGILKCAGIDGFLTNNKRFYAQADMETEQWEILVELWWGKFQSQAVTAKTLLTEPSIWEWCESILGQSFNNNLPHKLALALRSKKDRIFSNKQIINKGPDSSKTTLYALVDMTANQGG